MEVNECESINNLLFICLFFFLFCMKYYRQLDEHLEFANQFHNLHIHLGMNL